MHLISIYKTTNSNEYSSQQSTEVSLKIEHKVSLHKVQGN